MRFLVVCWALADSSLVVVCGRVGDPSSIPPLPLAPGEAGILPDPWEYAKCAQAMRWAREQYVVDCSQSRSKQECRELAAERYKNQKAFCESLLLH